LDLEHILNEEKCVLMGWMWGMRERRDPKMNPRFLA
jgi:hypothetical protein